MTLTSLTYEILVALADRDRHGYSTLKEIESLGGSSPSTGAMYLALHRMVSEGLLKEVPPPPDSDDARRRYYRITDRGRKAAKRESARLASLLARARAKNLLTEETA